MAIAAHSEKSAGQDQVDAELGGLQAGFMRLVFGRFMVGSPVAADRIEEAVGLLEAGHLDATIREHFAPADLMEAAPPTAFSDVPVFSHSAWRKRHQA